MFKLLSLEGKRFICVCISVKISEEADTDVLAVWADPGHRAGYQMYVERIFSIQNVAEKHLFW